MQLKSRTTFPPQGFPYTQSEGIPHIFEAGGYSIEQQAARVSEFRKGNNLPRSGIRECAEDIEAFTCSRLGNDANYCYDPTGPVPENKLLVSGGGCAGCGANVS